MTSYAKSSGLELQRSTVTQGGEAATGASTVPPEIIQLIVNYLEEKELAKVIRLNWTWAQIAAPKLWEEINFSVNDNRIVFLITKSVAPQTLPDQVLAEPFPVVDIHETTRSYSSTSKESLDSSSSSSNSQQTLLVQKRRNSYPWPTLLRYHSMVRTLHVSLSSSVMIQDLYDIVACCNELRSFSIQSAIPVEEFLFRGAIATAYNEVLDPMAPTPISSPASRKLQSSNYTIDSTVHSYSTITPDAGIQDEDEETFSVSSTSQCGKLLKYLASSCPKLEKLWFSGFCPISVLGKPTDLRPTQSTGVDQNSKSSSQVISDEDMIGPPLVDTNTESTLPPRRTGDQLPPGRVTGSTISTYSSLGVINKSPVPTTSGQVQSKIRQLQFTNCIVPPSYLLTMIQHSLPKLEVLHLTDCWRGTPIDETFLESLAKICPGLREITLHSTRPHSGVIGPASVLKMLQSLESKIEKKKYGFEPQKESSHFNVLANYPLGMFSGVSRYNKNPTPSISSTAATIGSTSNNNSTSSLSSFSSSSGILPQQQQQYEGSYSALESAESTIQHRPSSLESISIWFPNSTLDSDIVLELADTKRHPVLKAVDFGSEDPFDDGEQLVQSLLEHRPELRVCSWISYGDTGEDRDD